MPIPSAFVQSLLSAAGSTIGCGQGGVSALDVLARHGLIPDEFEEQFRAL